MKAILILLLTFCAFKGFSQTRIAVHDAVKHIGDSVTVCDIVTGGIVLEKSSTVLLNMGGTYPNHLLTVMFQSALLKDLFFKTVADVKGKGVCVTGKIIDYKGKPEIIIKKPADITVTK